MFIWHVLKGPKISQINQCFGKTSKIKWIIFDKKNDFDIL